MLKINFNTIHFLKIPVKKHWVAVHLRAELIVRH